MTTRRSVTRSSRLRWRGRHPLWGWAIITAFLAVLAGSAVLAMGGSSGTDQRAEQRAALQLYAQNLGPLVDKAGEVVAMGLRAGVDDIHDSRYDDETLATMTKAWGDDLRRLRTQLDRLDPPAFLAEAHALYLDSFGAYADVAQTLAAAVAAHGQERIDLVLQAAHQGESADAVYDRATALVDEHRRRLNLPVEAHPWSKEAEEGARRP